MLVRAGVVFCLTVATLLASEHRGQVQFGGLPVPGASVTVTQGDRKLTAITDAKGIYDFPDLADGNWKIHVEMLCFVPIDRDIVVSAGAPEAIWELKLLPFSEIQAAAGPQAPKPATPPAPLSLTTSSQPAPAARPETRAEAPAKAKPRSRNAKSEGPPPNPQAGFQRADLNASTAPGTLSNDPTEASQNQNAADGLLVNGSVNNGAASPFAQSPAFGNNRKGVRSLYNGGFGFTLDNAALDARQFSLTGQDTPKPGYNYMQGFASFGGPLYIPHIMRPSRTPLMFFIGYQWIRNRTATTQPGLMPTAAERAGDFSQALNPLGKPLSFADPLSGAPFPGNVIPQSRIKLQATSLLGLYPAPNFASNSRYNYQVPLLGITDIDGVQGTLNKIFSMKNQLNGSYGYQRTSSVSPSIFGFTDSTEVSGFQGTLGFSHRFSTHLFTRLSAQYSRGSSRITPYFANRQNVSGEAQIAGNNQDPLNWGPPALSFASGISGLTDANQSFDRNQTWIYSANSYWNHRSHNLTFGADLRKLEFNNLSQQNPRGRFTFTGAATQVPGQLGSGSDFADFLLGIPDTLSIAYGNADKYFRTTSYDAFLTDDWRLNSGVTLNLGARWEYSAPITEKYGRLVNLDIGPGFTTAAPVVANSPTGSITGQHYPDSLLAPDKGALQPRVGLAWRPFAASSLIIRAGYGVYYNTSVYQSIAIQMAQQLPLSLKSWSVQNTPQNPLTLANGFNAPPPATSNTFAVDPHFRVGYAQNWNVLVQRDLPGALVMTATYLGIKGTREQQEFLPNTYPLGAVNPCPECPVGYTYLTSNGNSTREAAQIQVRRRMHNGITGSLSYTFSKSIDDASLGGRPSSPSGSGGGGGGGGNGGGMGSSGGQSPPAAAVIAQDWLNLSGERGLSAFDQRHLLTLQAQYSTGMGTGGGALLTGWKGRLYKGWTVTSSISAGSGLPQSPIYVAPVQGTGVSGTIRPEYTGAPLYSAPAGFFLNPAAYIAPLPGTWGNAARNSIIGPSQFSLGGAVTRNFRLTDRFNADVRLDATNALNHVNYTSWNTNINSAQFGLPTLASTMRRVQASIRVRF